MADDTLTTDQKLAEITKRSANHNVHESKLLQRLQGKDGRANNGKHLVRYHWAKGVSGNPGGRRAIPPEVRESCRVYTMEAVGTLIHWMRQREDANASIKSAIALLERGWGKAPQLVGVVNSSEGPTTFTISIGDDDITEITAEVPSNGSGQNDPV